jgi:hypothetical protein
MFFGAVVALAPTSSMPLGAASQPLTRAELLRRVDRKTLAQKHHIDLSRLDQLDLRILLSIDSVEIAQSVGFLSVTYTLTNLTLQPAGGTTTGRFQGRSLVNLDGSTPVATSLAPGQSRSGSLRTSSPLLAGVHELTLLYRDMVTCHQKPGPRGVPIEVCVAGVTADASASVTVNSPAPTDSDGDGISDALESLLLARFRPFYRFSRDGGEEEYRPADAEWYIRHSELHDHQSETDPPKVKKEELSNNPALILSGSQAGHYLNIDNAFRAGDGDWNRIAAEATGLYGRVSPLNLNSPKPHEVADPAQINAYKIEYWQFFAFDQVPGQSCTAGVGDTHEGDWEGIQLVIAAGADLKILRVRHNVHSTDVVFDLANASGPSISLGGGFVEYRGPGVGDPSFDLWLNKSSDTRNSSRVRFFCNEDGCTHPVAYIEYGGHAFWPTEFWTWPVMPKHGGDSSHAYLVTPPTNLGEFGRPNPQCSACALVLGFEGHWGACGNDPPRGPRHQGSWSVP